MLKDLELPLQVATQQMSLAASLAMETRWDVLLETAGQKGQCISFNLAASLILFLMCLTWNTFHFCF